MHLDKIENYWDLRAKGYSKKNSDELFSDVADVWTDRLNLYIPKGKALRCLDIGCGPGFLGILFAKMGHKVTFADYSNNMLERAKKNAQDSLVMGEFIKMDAQNTAFEDDVFDVIVSRNLVWNLEKPQRAYDEWLRILKKGGKLIIFDGNHYLFCFNEKYMEERKCRHYKDPHTKEYMQGVDVSIMNEIAVNLPLSSLERPKWDMEFFLEKRVKSIQVEPVWNDFLLENEEKKSIIRAFTVCVEK